MDAKSGMGEHPSHPRSHFQESILIPILPAGLEPARPKPADFKSATSTYFVKGATNLFVM